MYLDEDEGNGGTGDAAAGASRTGT